MVDASNLQRQILHNLDRVGDRKVDWAKKTLSRLNPDVDVVNHEARLTPDNVLDVIAGYDVIVDGADNFQTRYLVNDAALRLGIPVVHGVDLPLRGHDHRVHPAERARLPDLVPSRRRRSRPRRARRPACSACCPGIMGGLQATEAVKLLLGLGEPLAGRLLSVDTTDMSFRTFNLRKDPANPVTYENRDRIQIQDLEGLCAPGLSH